MKKCKVLLMTTVLAVMLCACGGDKTEASAESDAGSAASVKKEEVAESSSKETSKEAQGGFECLPEILEASPEDRLFQVGDVILKVDESMSLKEAIDALEAGSVEYKYVNYEDDKEFNFDRLLPGGKGAMIALYKNGEEFVILGAYNTSSELVSALDSAVKLRNIVGYDVEEDFYYFGGLRPDGKGQTLESVKELMAPYEDSLTVDTRYGYSLEYEYTWTSYKGEHEGTITFDIDLDDGSCASVYVE
ncbi:MAG: hypothetical protein IJ324_08065 [Lachnospiraceae bacterium]|nr:hypothetical protein [Lachnospiraceae bacterium]